MEKAIRKRQERESLKVVPEIESLIRRLDYLVDWYVVSSRWSVKMRSMIEGLTVVDKINHYIQKTSPQATLLTWEVAVKLKKDTYDILDARERLKDETAAKMGIERGKRTDPKAPKKKTTIQLRKGAGVRNIQDPIQYLFPANPESTADSEPEQPKE